MVSTPVDTLTKVSKPPVYIYQDKRIWTETLCENKLIDKYSQALPYQNLHVKLFQDLLRFVRNGGHTILGIAPRTATAYYH